MATSTQTPRSRTKRPSTSPKRATSTSSAPNAVALLTQDHREVEALFKKFEGLGKRAHKGREATVGKIIESLSKHAVIEEQVFYPDVRARMTDLNEDVLEALEEHHVVKWTLSELEKMSSEDERFEAKVTVLMESVRHHVKEEEKGLFPKVRKALSRSDLEEMGEQLAAAKKAAPNRPHPRSPDAPPANIVATALTAPMDAAASVMSSAVDKIRDATR